LDKVNHTQANRRNQILSTEFHANGYRATWHYQPWGPLQQPIVLASGPEDYDRKRQEQLALNKFLQLEALGRFFVDRTSRPGYWFEHPHDAMLYKLRFLT